MLLFTTVFIGNLNNANNTGMMINAPPAPTKITPIPNPTIINSKGLDFVSCVVGLTLIKHQY